MCSLLVVKLRRMDDGLHMEENERGDDGFDEGMKISFDLLMSNIYIRLYFPLNGGKRRSGFDE